VHKFILKEGIVGDENLMKNKKFEKNLKKVAKKFAYMKYFS
jgi:hypothetical protein